MRCLEQVQQFIIVQLQHVAADAKIELASANLYMININSYDYYIHHNISVVKKLCGHAHRDMHVCVLLCHCTSTNILVSIHQFVDGLERPWGDARSYYLVVAVLPTNHGVGLTAAGLPVGKDTHIVAIDGRLNQILRTENNIINAG